MWQGWAENITDHDTVAVCDTHVQRWGATRRHSCTAASWRRLTLLFPTRCQSATWSTASAPTPVTDASVSAPPERSSNAQREAPLVSSTCRLLDATVRRFPLSVFNVAWPTVLLLALSQWLWSENSLYCVITIHVPPPSRFCFTRHLSFCFCVFLSVCLSVCLHVLQPFLPDRPVLYNLRRRPHCKKSTKTVDLSNNDYIIRVTYKDSYWHYSWRNNFNHCIFSCLTYLNQFPFFLNYIMVAFVNFLINGRWWWWCSFT